MKLKLKDGTIIPVLTAGDYDFTTNQTPEQMIETFTALNQRNLSKIERLSDDDVLLGEYVNKDKVSCKYQDGVCYYELRDVNEIEVRLTELEGAFDEFSETVMEIIGGGE